MTLKILHPSVFQIWDVVFIFMRSSEYRYRTLKAFFFSFFLRLLYSDIAAQFNDNYPYYRNKLAGEAKFDFPPKT